MFSNNDFYNLDDATKTLKNKQLMLSMYIKMEALTQLMIKHNITNELEIEACENYIKSLPHVKKMVEEMEQAESQIKNYKADPRQHLRDLMAAKMNGSIK
ncbi:hypothetical protein EVU96_08850 [Bacillus infantis]|uniref:hypothetical protein n=1 Tax=Bacillus infantis TaxID=324767 RepID=UPI00101C1C82|nr:hypothetical protein [Bacillus infantis]RYI30512.1 hypothetical protein EVU96_08850 [Bacillus infantis]